MIHEYHRIISSISYYIPVDLENNVAVLSSLDTSNTHDTCPGIPFHRRSGKQRDSRLECVKGQNIWNTRLKEMLTQDKRVKNIWEPKIVINLSGGI